MIQHKTGVISPKVKGKLFDFIQEVVMAAADDARRDNGTSRDVDLKIFYLNSYALMNSCVGILTSEFSRLLADISDKSALSHGVIPS